MDDGGGDSSAPGDGADTPAASAFGSRLGQDGEADLLDTVAAAGGVSLASAERTVPATLRRAETQTVQDSATVAAAGRWRPGRRDPDMFVPGDVVALRSIVTSTLLAEADQLAAAMSTGRLGADDEEATAAGLVHKAGIAGLLTTAVPYFLAADDAVALLHASPPDAGLIDAARMPFPAMLVCFGADLELPPTLLATGTSHARESRARRDHLERIGAAGPSFGDRGPDLESQMADRGGFLTGLVLLADADGRLRNEAGFVVAAAEDPQLPEPLCHDRIRGVVFGCPTEARAGFVVHNVAAALAWAVWDRPEATFELPDHDHPDFSRVVNTGRFRRQEPRGALAGVRVFDLDRTTRAAVPRDGVSDAPARRPPGRHWRAAHWRRVRVGPRDDWHYEGRLIGPTVVNPDQPAATSTVRTRRVPDRATSDPEARHE